MLYNLLSTMSDDDNSISNNNSSNGSSDENFIKNDDILTKNEATLLVNSATCKNVSPADIRKLLSAPEKKKPQDKGKFGNKVLANKTSTSDVDNNKDEIAINGKVYRSVNKAVTYFMPKHDRTHPQSLVDRGATDGVSRNNKAITHFLSKHDRTHSQSRIDREANGGVAGEDVRVISKALDRKFVFVVLITMK